MTKDSAHPAAASEVPGVVAVVPLREQINASWLKLLEDDPAVDKMLLAALLLPLLGDLRRAECPNAVASTVDDDAPHVFEQRGHPRDMNLIARGLDEIPEHAQVSYDVARFLEAVPQVLRTAGASRAS